MRVRVAASLTGFARRALSVAAAPIDVPAAVAAAAPAALPSPAVRHHSVTATIGERPLSLEVGRIGPLTDSVVFARYGDTSVLATAVAARFPADSEDSGLPLSVEYRERAFAFGLIPDASSRRESTTDRETLIGRIVDRSVRPLFDAGFASEAQIIVTLLSYDRDCDPTMLSVIAASAALHAGPVPWHGPAACVRVGWVGGAPLVCPPASLMRTGVSSLDLRYSGASGGRTLMLELGASQLPEADLVRALRAADSACGPIIDLQHALREGGGKPKRHHELHLPSEELVEAARMAIFVEAKECFREARDRKAARGQAQARLVRTAEGRIKERYPTANARHVSIAAQDAVRSALRAAVLEAAAGEAAAKRTAMSLFASGDTAQVLTIDAARTAGEELIGSGGGEAMVGEPLVSTSSDVVSESTAAVEVVGGASLEAAVETSSTTAAVSTAASSEDNPVLTTPPGVVTDGPVGVDFVLIDATGARVDGRDTTSVRPLKAAVDVLPLVHGSSLFSRGDTQVLATVTLGPLDMSLVLAAGPALTSAVSDAPAFVLGTTRGEGEVTSRSLSVGGGHGGISGEKEVKNFFLHYDFPPYATNEQGKLAGANRRMVGHGALAERALAAVMPSEETFPYAVRVVGETTGSDGSSSMATVCAASLALADAGVPISSHVAGVSIGALTSAGTGAGGGTMPRGSQYVLLTDILGLEDYAGDCDFKVAGTRVGITAAQLDVKPAGLPLEVIEAALLRARAGRGVILDALQQTLATHRRTLKAGAPGVLSLELPADLRSKLIGPGGSNIRRIESLAGVQLVLDLESTRFSIYGSPDGLLAAQALISASVSEVLRASGSPLALSLSPSLNRPKLVVGVPVTARVAKVTEFGVVLESLPLPTLASDEAGAGGGAAVAAGSGDKPQPPIELGWMHISDFARSRTAKASDLMSEGDVVTVQTCDVDSRGRGKFSIRALLRPGEEVEHYIRRASGVGGGAVTSTAGEGEAAKKQLQVEMSAAARGAEAGAGKQGPTQPQQQQQQQLQQQKQHQLPPLAFKHATTGGGGAGGSPLSVATRATAAAEVAAAAAAAATAPATPLTAVPPPPPSPREDTHASGGGEGGGRGRAGGGEPHVGSEEAVALIRSMGYLHAGTLLARATLRRMGHAGARASWGQ